MLIYYEFHVVFDFNQNFSVPSKYDILDTLLEMSSFETILISIGQYKSKSRPDRSRLNIFIISNEYEITKSIVEITIDRYLRGITFVFLNKLLRFILIIYHLSSSLLFSEESYQNLST